MYRRGTERSLTVLQFEVYVNKAPDRPVDRLVREYLRFMLSAEGQRVVIKAGFHPLDAKTVARELYRLEE